jgi:phage terminase small subunit
MGEKFTALKREHQRFIKAYIEKGDAQLAAEGAGLKPAAGYRLLDHTKIQEALDEVLEEQKLTPDQVMVRLKHAACSDMADYEDFLMGKITLKGLRDRGVRTDIIESVEVRPTKNGVVRKIKLMDKHKATDLVTKCLGMQTQTHKHEHTLSFDQAIRQLQEADQDTRIMDVSTPRSLPDSAVDVDYEPAEGHRRPVVAESDGE